MRGRRPKPTSLKVLQGNAGHRKNDGMKEVSMPPGTPEPPAHLSVGAKQEFFRVVKYLSQVNGLLTPTDHAGIGIYCSYYDQWQQAEERIPRLQARMDQLEKDADAVRESLRTVTKRTPKAQVTALNNRRESIGSETGRALAAYNMAVGDRNRSRKEMRAYLSELGLTPAARARLRVPDGQMNLPGMGGPQRPADPLEEARRQMMGA